MQQQAWRIRVASSPERLRGGQAELWDSGRVESPDSVSVAFGGPPLGSRQRCHWQVEVWAATTDGLALRATSPVGGWEMGLLQPGDWSASWIAAESPEARDDREAGLLWRGGDRKSVV